MPAIKLSVPVAVYGLLVPIRPLALVSVLAFGDYMLWNWSLSANHDVLALVSGLTLPPLVLAWLWLLALTLGRALGHTRRHTREVERDRAHRMADARQRSATAADDSPPMEPVSAAASPTSASSPTQSPGKLAA
jgi:hypothetical protein